MVSSIIVQAQDEKKIVIIKKTIDKDGNETVTETVIEGDDVDEFEVEKYEIESIDDLDIDIDIQKIITENSSENKNRIIKIITEGEDGQEIKVDVNASGNEIKTINIKGDDSKMIFLEGDNLPEDIEKILEGKGIKIDLNNESHRIIIKDDGEPKAFLGVWPGEETNEGVTLGGIVENSAAEKSGLKEGDVVTSIADKTVKSFSDLSKIIKSKAPGDEVKIQYIRENENRSTIVKLGESKRDVRKEYITKIPRSFNSCKDIKSLSKEDLFMRGYSFSNSCCKNEYAEKAYIGIMISNTEEDKVIIQDVHRDGDQLQSNDIITKFGRSKVSDVNQLIDLVRTYEPGDRVKIKFIRDGKEMKEKVTLLGRNVKICCTTNDCCNPKENDINIDNIEEDLSINIIKSDLGNARLELSEVKLFPNPNNGKFSLNFVSEDLSPLTISVTDATGKEIVRDEIQEFNGKYTGEFTLAGNSPGIYFVNISQNNKIYIEKVIFNNQK